MNGDAIIVEVDYEGGLIPLAHRPAPTSGNRKNNQFPNLEETWAPEEWPAACAPADLRGLVYLHAGALAKLPECPTCAILVPAGPSAALPCPICQELNDYKRATCTECNARLVVDRLKATV